MYEFVWDEYCDWYVEIAKVQMAGNDAQQRATRRTLIRVLETTLRLAHPIIPFITEELWQKVAPLAGARGRKHHDGALPAIRAGEDRRKRRAEMAAVKDVVNAARNLRSTLGVPPAAKVPLYIADAADFLARHRDAIAAVARASEVHFVPALPERDSPVTITASGKVMLHVEIDPAAERARMEKAAARLEAEIANARGKLSKPSFVDKAPPAVVEQERKRLADKEAELAQIKAQLGKLA